ncbi:hypothetical protein C8R43DRAFT_1176549 [Mycena crocata]|nr:hypothetical protein C8R43DRAFT_1176549 [Mycena crocata]
MASRNRFLFTQSSRFYCLDSLHSRRLLANRRPAAQSARPFKRSPTTCSPQVVHLHRVFANLPQVHPHSAISQTAHTSALCSQFTTPSIRVQPRTPSGREFASCLSCAAGDVGPSAIGSIRDCMRTLPTTLVAARPHLKHTNAKHERTEHREYGTTESVRAVASPAPIPRAQHRVFALHGLTSRREIHRPRPSIQMGQRRARMRACSVQRVLAFWSPCTGQAPRLSPTVGSSSAELTPKVRCRISLGA